MGRQQYRGPQLAWRVLGLSLLGALAGGGRVGAQDPALARLTDPRTVTIPAQNPTSGRFTLAVKPMTGRGEYQVYVPPTCVGRRCPLYVFLRNSLSINWLIPGADKYGLIVLLTGRPSGGLKGALERGERHPMTTELDAALQEVYQRFAIEPDKIALLGRCGTTDEASFWAYHNPTLFSRVILNSGTGWSGGETWPNPSTQFLFDYGLQSSYWFNALHLRAGKLRRQGVTVTEALSFRRHEHQHEDYMFVARWLHQSWSPPTERRAPVVVADPLPRLTPTILAKMTAFWTWFQEQPYWVRLARRRYLREVVLPVGDLTASLWMTDFGAWAAERSWMARELEKAGLTAAEHDAYRVALASALYLNLSKEAAASPMNGIEQYMITGSRQLVASVPAGSVLAQNAEFIAAHPEEMQVFDVSSDRDQGKQNRMWYMP